MVREVPDHNGYEAYRSFVLRYGTRDAHRETTLLIKVMNFNFGDIDDMESKFKEFNLLIKDQDDISGKDNVPDTIKRAILVARAPDSLRTHLQLNSQSYTHFLEMRQAITQFLKARKGFKLKERDDEPMDIDLVHREASKRTKGKDNEQGKSAGKGNLSQETFRGTCRNCGKTGHRWSECWAKGGGAAKQPNSVGERKRNLVT